MFKPRPAKPVSSEGLTADEILAANNFDFSSLSFSDANIVVSLLQPFNDSWDYGPNEFFLVSGEPSSLSESAIKTRRTEAKNAMLRLSNLSDKSVSTQKLFKPSRYSAISSFGEAPTFDNPKQLSLAAEEYYNWVEQNPFIEEKPMVVDKTLTYAEIEKPRPMSVSGLISFLDITYEAFLRLKITVAFKEAVERIESIIYTQNYELAASGFLSQTIVNAAIAFKRQRDEDASLMLAASSKPIEIQIIPTGQFFNDKGELVTEEQFIADLEKETVQNGVLKIA